MLEQQRQAYLEAMGVPLWFPRYKLPGALRTPEYPWPESNGQKQEKSAQASQLIQATPKPVIPSDYQNSQQPHVPSHFSDQPLVAKAQIRESLLDTSKDPQQLKPSSATAVDTAHEKPCSDQVLEKQLTVKEPCFFQLVCMVPNDQVLLVTELPYSGVNELSALHYSLVNNLLIALQVGSGVKDSKVFKWPFTHQSFIDQSESVARAAVKTYLEEQLGFSNKKLAIFMGPTAVKYGLGLEEDFDLSRGVQQQNDQWIAVTHSLNEILRLPQYKKESWLDIAAITNIKW